MPDPTPEYDLSLLTDHERETWIAIAALEVRAKALRQEEGAPELGSAIENLPESWQEDPEGYTWISWLRPNELELLMNCLALGVFVHVKANVTFGASGRAKKGEKPRRELLTTMAQHVRHAAGLSVSTEPTLKLLQLVAHQREQKATFVAALTELAEREDFTAEQLQETLRS